MENMQHIGNVNNVMNTKDGNEYSGSRDGLAINRVGSSKFPREMESFSFPYRDEHIPAVDSLDDILGRSEESDDASKSFELTANNKTDGGHYYSRGVTTKDENTEDRCRRNIARDGLGRTAVGLDGRVGRTAVGLNGRDRPKPALLSENRKRSQSPRKVTFNNSVEPIGNTVISPRSNSLQRALERIRSYKKASQQRARSRKPPTPYKVNAREPSRLARSLQIDTTFQDREPSTAKLSPTKVSCVSGDSKISKGIAEKSVRVTSPKAPVLLTTEKHGERIYSCTTPENKRHALKSPMNDFKSGRQKTETMQEIRNKLFEDFRHFPTTEGRTTPRTTVPKPFFLRTEERIAFRHLIHPPEASYEEEQKFRPFKALPMPNYEADPLFHGIRLGKRHTIPEPFQLSSPKNTPGRPRISVDDEGVGRYRFRALPVPDFSYRPSSISSHEVNLTTPFPFHLQLDERMASRIRFNGTARTNTLAKMYIRACSIINENDDPEPEVEVDTPIVEKRLASKGAVEPEIHTEGSSTTNRYKTQAISSTTKLRKTPDSNSYPDVSPPIHGRLSPKSPTTLQAKKMPNHSKSGIVKKSPLNPLPPKPVTANPIATKSPRRSHASSTHLTVRSAPSTPTGSQHSPTTKSSFKARKMPDFSKPFVPVKKPPSPLQSQLSTPPRIAVSSPRSSNTSINRLNVRSAPSTPTGSSPKSRTSFKAKKMPDFSKPFVPVKKPPSPLKPIPTTSPRIAINSPRSSNNSVKSTPSTPIGMSPKSEADFKTRMANFSNVSVPMKKQPNTPQRMSTTPPQISMNSPRRTNSSSISASTSPNQSTSAGPSRKSTTGFKAKKMPDFSKPFVPIKKPPSPLQKTRASPSQSASSPRFTSSRISISSPKSTSSLTSMNSYKSAHFRLPGTSPKRISPTTTRVNQDIETVNSSSPTASRSIRPTITSVRKTDSTHSYQNVLKSPDSTSDKARTQDLNSACSIKLNEPFSARRMPDFSKPFVPVKTMDIERALVQAVSKDKKLLGVLDNKLNDYKNRLIEQEFGDIRNDLDGHEKIRQLADVIVKEVIEDVAALRSASMTSMISSKDRRMIDLSKKSNNQDHDSKMNKTLFQQDSVNAVKTSDSGLSVSSNENSVDPYLSYSATISPANSTIEGETKDKTTAEGQSNPHSVDFVSATTNVSEVRSDRLFQRNETETNNSSSQKSLASSLRIHDESIDRIDLLKDPALACPPSSQKFSNDFDLTGDSSSRGFGFSEQSAKYVKDNDGKLFDSYSSKDSDGQSYQKEWGSAKVFESIENVSEGNGAAVDHFLGNRVNADMNSIGANNRYATGLVSHNTYEDNHDDALSISERISKDNNYSAVAAFDASPVSDDNSDGPISTNHRREDSDDNNRSLSSQTSENESCYAIEDSSGSLEISEVKYDDVKTSIGSEILPSKQDGNMVNADTNSIGANNRYATGLVSHNTYEDNHDDALSISERISKDNNYSAVAAFDASPVSDDNSDGPISTDHRREDSDDNNRSLSSQTSENESCYAIEDSSGSLEISEVKDSDVKTLMDSEILPSKEHVGSYQHHTIHFDGNGRLLDHKEDCENEAHDVVIDRITTSDIRTESNGMEPSEEKSFRTSKDDNKLLKGRATIFSSIQEPTCHSRPNTDTNIPRSHIAVSVIDRLNEKCERKQVTSKCNTCLINSDHDNSVAENSLNTERSHQTSCKSTPSGEVISNTAGTIEKSDYLECSARPHSDIEEQIGSTKDIATTTLFSATSTDSDDATSHKQFSSHTEASLAKVLHSLNNTMERISLIERKFEKKYPESSMSKTKIRSPTKDHLNRDDFGSETVAFRAGWKRALELTDLIEYQDENLPPDTSRSPKLVESRFVMTHVKNDLEEARDDYTLITREKEHTQTPNKSRAVGSIEKPHFSLYDSVLRCCSGKGDLD